MKNGRRAVIAIACAAALVASAKGALSHGGAPLRTSEETAAAKSPLLPVLRTTGARIALGNLDAQIKGREDMLARKAGDALATKTLIELLLARGEYASRIADYERAASLSEAFLAAHPESGDAHLLRASTLGMFHQFKEESAELDAAERAHAPAAAVRTARATLLMAQGRFDEADATGAWKDTDLLDTMGLTAAAVLAGERAQPAESERLFERARAKFHDVSPFPVAWMDFQRGALLERQAGPGDRQRAKAYFEEAHAALPNFAHPAVHLAGLVPAAEALTILEPLVGKGDDPQVDVAYADALRRMGRKAEVAQSLERAKARYDELVREHPLAFADHAAQFYDGLGNDPARALILARENAENRPTEPALDQWITAALLAGAPGDACTASLQGAALPYATPAFRATVATAHTACGAQPRATAD